MTTNLLIITVLISLYRIACSRIAADGPATGQASEPDSIREIFHKICNISTGNIRNANYDEKLKKLKILETQLKKSAKKLGHEKKIDLILAGLKVMILNNNFTLCSKAYPTNRKVFTADVPASNMENSQPIESKPVELKSIEPKPIESKPIEPKQLETKQIEPKPIVQPLSVSETKTSDLTIMNSPQKPKIKKLLQKMVLKLENLAKNSFTNVTTPEEKKRVLSKIRARVSAALKKRNLSVDSRNNSYSDLIMQGVELMLLDKDDPRRMSLKALKDLKELDLPETDKDIIKMRSINKMSFIDTTTERGLLPTTNSDCTYLSKKVCRLLTDLNDFICAIDDTKITVDKLCDGAIDCPDGSDELNCAKKAISRVHNASEVISSIHDTSSCFSSPISEKVFAEQGGLLSSVLESEINFLNKYNDVFPSVNEKVTLDEINKRTVQEVSNEVFVILHTFHKALYNAFCIDPLVEIEKITKENDQELNELDMDIVQRVFSLRTCKCKGRLCASLSCPITCKRICYQKYSLARFSCTASNGDTSIPLDWLCNGKMDCIDEKDEKDCRFEDQSKPVSVILQGNIMFNEVLNIIKSRTGYNEYEPARKQLALLYNAIKELQKMTVQKPLKYKPFKILRDRCFKGLVSVYDALLNSMANSNSLSESEDVYDYLINVNNKLAHALKLSQTGNEVIIAPTSSCNCRGFSCIYCSTKCQRICASRPLLTEYACTGYGRNATRVSSDMICNGKVNCVGGKDEETCMKERCRNHHLVVLRHHLQKVGEKHVGSVLGEILSVWKTKALARLVVDDKPDRPGKRDFREVIDSILDDLVDAYSLVDKYRKANPELILKKFEKLSQRILEQLKTCNF